MNKPTTTPEVPQELLPEWTERAGIAADLILEQILGCKVIRQGSDGLGSQHLAFMATELAKRNMSPTKACRWLGYLQAGLIFYGLSTLEEEKQRNLKTAAMYAKAQADASGEAVAWTWEERQYNGTTDIADSDKWIVEVGPRVPEYKNGHLWVRNARPLYTHPTPSGPVEVTEEMVTAASEAYCPGSPPCIIDHFRPQMRAALNAALAGKNSS